MLGNALGELRTDERGRLLFLGGHGRSDTVFPHNPPTTFANNNGWYDDISDGPVSAEVTIDGRSIAVDPAWVVVAPPNYAPDIVAIQTMYDVLYDIYQTNWLAPVTTLSFTEHIYPTLCRFCEMQWVNYGFHVQFGWGAPHDFLRPSFFAKLASNRKEYKEVRQQVFNMFRNPSFQTLDVDGWPQVYGDAASLASADPRQFMALTVTQYQHLQRWAEGDFSADWKPHAQPQRIEDIELSKRPGMLDKAALTYCIGGPFHPGCEMTWPMRHITMYYAPFRIRPRAPNQPEADYGDALDPSIFSSKNENGPLYANGPGDITRWMALPWQTDSASCQSGYEPEYDPYLPTFWPARVPNDVLRMEEYQHVMDPARPLEERILAFNTRAPWLRGLSKQYLASLNEMIAEFGKLGIVERREGPRDSDDFPAVMYVETQRASDSGIDHDGPRIVGRAEKITRHQQHGRSAAPASTAANGEQAHVSPRRRRSQRA